MCTLGPGSQTERTDSSSSRGTCASGTPSTTAATPSTDSWGSVPVITPSVPRVVPHGWNAVDDAACKKHPPPAIDDGSNVIGYKTHRWVAPRTMKTYSVCCEAPVHSPMPSFT
uniref:(northern house mosquito) hypothetical protein n=1 Tax=Culex pipiens TaxID=7175 RepID=A0A8D8DNM1_CULPI